MVCNAVVRCFVTLSQPTHARCVWVCVCVYELVCFDLLVYVYICLMRMISVSCSLLWDIERVCVCVCESLCKVFHFNVFYMLYLCMVPVSRQIRISQRICQSTHYTCKKFVFRHHCMYTFYRDWYVIHIFPWWFSDGNLSTDFNVCFQFY